MPRRRMIDPDFWLDSRIKELSPAERLLFIGMISRADDEGRLPADPAYLRSQIFPYDDFTLEDIRNMRDHIIEVNPNVQLYTNAGEEYIYLRKWSRYQKPSHPQPSRLPKPPESHVLESFRTNSEIKPKSFQNAAGTIPSQDRLGKVRLGTSPPYSPPSPTVPEVPAVSETAGDSPGKTKPRQKPYQAQAGIFLDLVEKRQATKLVERPKLIQRVRALFSKFPDLTPERLYECFSWLKQYDPFCRSRDSPTVIMMLPAKYPEWAAGKLRPAGRIGGTGLPTTEELERGWHGKSSKDVGREDSG